MQSIFPQTVISNKVHNTSPTSDRICWFVMIPFPDPWPTIRLRGTRGGHQLVGIDHPIPSGRRGTLKSRRDRQGRLALEQCSRILRQLDTSTQARHAEGDIPMFEQKIPHNADGSMMSPGNVSRCNVGGGLVWRLPRTTAPGTSTSTII